MSYKLHLKPVTPNNFKAISDRCLLETHTAKIQHERPTDKKYDSPQNQHSGPIDMRMRDARQGKVARPRSMLNTRPETSLRYGWVSKHPRGPRNMTGDLAGPPRVTGPGGSSTTMVFPQVLSQSTRRASDMMLGELGIGVR